MMGSPRNAARFCWILTVLSFVLGAIGMASGYMVLFYIALIGIIIFMVLLPMFVVRCPYCREKLPTRGMLHMDKCPYCGHKFD